MDSWHTTRGIAGQMLHTWVKRDTSPHHPARLMTTDFPAQFKLKAKQLQGSELVDAGRQLLSVDAPQSMIDALIEIVFDRNGEEAAEKFVDLIFA